MTRVISATNINLHKSQSAKPKAEIRAKIDSVLAGLSARYDHSDDKAERLAVLNSMDELVSAEIFYWSNVLNDIPENCSPCMEVKGNEAKNMIAELTPIIDNINSLRAELVKED